jgi:serine/threonine protein kinase
MTPEEWHKIKQVLQAVLELDPSDRRIYLDGVCANQEVNRTEIEELVSSYEQDGAFLELPIDLAAMDLIQEVAVAPWTGRRLGPYQIIEKIGEGGMGTVLRATRVDGLYDKEVAIKVIRHGLDTSFFVARFRNESRILGGLEHPNIARLLDGGVTKEDLPYVVLEHVAGVPIDEYCDQHGLTTDDRLKLFRTVCSAVQYAHQNLIVHRDLKPGNILVTKEGAPKLLDFGIAKILDPQQEETADRTLTMLRMMTPDFASPEQVRGDTITTASDVYSLGVILYLLLTGKRPYRVNSSSPQEMIKAVCETDPEKPSTAAHRSKPAAPATSRTALSPGVAGADGVPARESLRRPLNKDLDYIVLKALRKEPTRRYATVEQFSEDIRRHLEHLPVSARKDTLGYRTSKFVTRHKAGVAAAVAIASILIAGMLVTLREARIAERRFNDVRSLSNSLIFEIHDSIKNLPGSTPARKLIVDRALQYLDSLAQESRGDLSLQRELAGAYERVGLVQGEYLQNSLGDTKGSLLSYLKALQIRLQVEAKTKDWNDQLSLAHTHRRVANQQWAMGDHSGAAENASRAVVMCESLNAAHPNTVKVLRELAVDYGFAGDLRLPLPAGEAGGPSQYFRKAVAADEEILRIDPDDGSALDAYAIHLFRVGAALEDDDPNAALQYYTKELEIEQGLHQHSEDIRYARGVAHAYSDIARVYEKERKYSLALENYSKNLDIVKQLIQIDPKNTLMQQSLAIAYVNTATESSKAGNKPQSLEFTKKSLEIMRGLVASAPENKQQSGILAAITVTGASTYLRLDEPNEALKEFEAARIIYESLHTPEAAGGPSLQAVACKEKMGEAAARLGNAELAGSYFHQSVADVTPVLSSEEPQLAALYIAADAYSGLGGIELRAATLAGQEHEKQREHLAQARSWYLKSLDAWHRIKNPSRDGPNDFDAGDPAQVSKSLQRCNIALAKLKAGPRL